MNHVQTNEHLALSTGQGADGMEIPYLVEKRAATHGVLVVPLVRGRENVIPRPTDKQQLENPLKSMEGHLKSPTFRRVLACSGAPSLSQVSVLTSALVL